MYVYIYINIYISVDRHPSRRVRPVPVVVRPLSVRPVVHPSSVRPSLRPSVVCPSVSSTRLSQLECCWPGRSGRRCCWYSVGTLPVLCWYSAGTLFVLCWDTISILLVQYNHCCFEHLGFARPLQVRKKMCFPSCRFFGFVGIKSMLFPDEA